MTYPVQHWQCECVCVCVRVPECACVCVCLIAARAAKDGWRIPWEITRDRHTLRGKYAASKHAYSPLFIPSSGDNPGSRAGLSWAGLGWAIVSRQQQPPARHPVRPAHPGKLCLCLFCCSNYICANTSICIMLSQATAHPGILVVYM